jgi:hypothetical protein
MMTQFKMFCIRYKVKHIIVVSWNYSRGGGPRDTLLKGGYPEVVVVTHNYIVMNEGGMMVKV